MPGLALVAGLQNNQFSAATWLSSAACYPLADGRERLVVADCCYDYRGITRTNRKPDQR